MNYEDLTPDSYLITMPNEIGQCVMLEATQYKNGRATLWAVRDESGYVMSKQDHLFAHEPNNSSKDDAFMAEFRFDNPQEALDSYMSFYYPKANA